MEEKIQLTKVNIVGEKFFHIFEDKYGNKIEVETTESEYRQLATPEHVNPTIKNGKWLRSYSRYKYDTVDGDLHEKEYVDNGCNYYTIVNGNELYVDKKDITTDKIHPSVVNNTLMKMVALQEKLTTI